MKIPAWLNNLLLAIYASSATVLPTLVDQHTITATLASEIGAGITIFAAAFHSAQAIASPTNSPTSSVPQNSPTAVIDDTPPHA